MIQAAATILFQRRLLNVEVIAFGAYQPLPWDDKTWTYFTREQSEDVSGDSEVVAREATAKELIESGYSLDFLCYTPPLVKDDRHLFP